MYKGVRRFGTYDKCLPVGRQAKRNLLIERERIAQEFALALERLAGASRLLHQRDLLTEQAGKIQGVGLPIPREATVQRVVAVEIHDGAFGVALRPSWTEVIDAATQAVLTQLEPLDQR